MTGIWSAGGDLGTARRSLGGTGTLSAGLVFGGYTSSNVATTEEYDGSSWSGGGDLGAACRAQASAGTQMAGLSAGGYTTVNVATTEEYDGAVWSAGGNLATARGQVKGCGTQTAGLSIGGYTTTYSNVTEEYDGASWSSGGNVATARRYHGSCGTQTEGLMWGGDTGSYLNSTEEYNGTSWSAGGNLVIAQGYMAGAGTQTAGLCCGGTNGTSGTLPSPAEEYDGSSWYSSSGLPLTRYSGAGGGSDLSAAFHAGGWNGTNNYANTYEYGEMTSWCCAGMGSAQAKSGTSLVSTGQWTPIAGDYMIAVVAADSDVVGTLSTTNTGILYNTTQSITVTNSGNVVCSLNIARIVDIAERVWSTGGNLNTARYGLGGAGTQSAGLSFGGWGGGTYKATTEEYDGASWSSGGDLGTARGGLSAVGCGTQTAGLSFGGLTGSWESAVTEEYDGAAWSLGGNLNTGRYDLGGCGTQTAGLSIGGMIYDSGSYTVLNTTEEYDGASWTVATGLSAARDYLSAFGTQTAGAACGGWTQDQESALTSTEEYDGSSWSAGGTLATAYCVEGTGFGTQAAGVAQGLTNAGSLGNSYCQEYDGSTWHLSGNLTRRSTPGSCGIQSAGLLFGGFSNSNATNETFEYNALAVSYSTITISDLTSESHAAAFYIARGLVAISPYDTGASATGTSTSPSSGASDTLAQANSLVIGGIGTEGPDGDTAGAWTAGAGNVSGNEQRLGSTGGTTENITVSAAAEIVSATSAQTAAKTGITSRDWAAFVAIFKQAATTGVHPPRIFFGPFRGSLKGSAL